MNSSIQPVIDKIEIVFEDDLIIGVNKPNNFLIHQSHYARNIVEITLLQKLESQLGYPLYPLHRLDRKTSGILLLLKNKNHVAKFQELFSNNTIQKTYYAIVRGFSPASGVIDSPIKEDDTGIYKEALTTFETLAQIELPIPVNLHNTSRYSLVKLMPHTGRMHQLRKHMNKINHPIIGDPKYGDRFHNRTFEKEFGSTYLLLHARQVEFIHPISQQKMKLIADFTDNWKMLLNTFFGRFRFDLSDK
ncbi:MAG: pseudouridine synthase [Crocinitomicaceae bacterium]|nr:pseudouridine synthase [Crocinitomicaceae bacterium]